MKWSKGFLAFLLALIIAASINLLGTRFYSRLDLTENKIYTVSKSTKGLLERLDDVVNIKVYFSKDLPPYLATLDREVKDLLDEYRARGGSKLQVEFVDPAADPATEQSLRTMGIPKVQLNIIQKDKAEVTGAYLGIAVQYEDKTEVIPVVQNINNLEYDLTAAIIKATTEPQTVGVAAPPNLTLTQGLAGLNQVLSEQYEVIEVDLAGPVPSSVTSLVVFDHDGLTTQHLRNLDAFVVNGGRLLALAPGVEVPEGTLSGQNRQVQLAPLLSRYGISVENSLVADGQSSMASFSQGYMTFTVPYSWWPQVAGDGLSPESPITATMDAITLPWASPVRYTGVDSTVGGSVESVVLAQSSIRSFAAQAPYNLDPQRRVTMPPTGAESQPLAVAVSGKVPSLQSILTPDSLGASVPDVSAETQIIVIGNARFITDSFLQQFQSNAVFMANAVDWMTLGSDLIAIRSRAGNLRPLKEVDDGRRNLLKWGGVLGMPILVVLCGLGRQRFLRARRSRLAAAYGGAA